MKIRAMLTRAAEHDYVPDDAEVIATVRKLIDAVTGGCNEVVKSKLAESEKSK